MRLFSSIEAALVQANANLRLSQVTLARWKRLMDKGVVSKQDGDEKQADFDVRQAEVAAAQANITAGHKSGRGQRGRSAAARGAEIFL